ncbi:hypothetical protein R6Q59_007188, partial [Mikania micrantha]
ERKCLFEIETLVINRELVCAHQQQSLPLLTCLEELRLESMDTLSHVWKCNNWKKIFILHKHQPQSSFQNLTKITLLHCNVIKYLFSPLNFRFLSSLKTLDIRFCEGIEEVVSNRDDDHVDDEVLNTSTTTFFPCLDYLCLNNLSNLKKIGEGVAKHSHVGLVPWSLCQYSTKIEIWWCPFLSSLIPSMVETFQSKIDQGSTSLPMSKTITTLPCELTNLQILKISECDILEYIFTFSILESLKKLEELRIIDCRAMKLIVREENEKESSKVVFPRLKSIVLKNLPNLVGFFMGIDIDFEWKSLDYVMIRDCPQMMSFTSVVYLYRSTLRQTDKVKDIQVLPQSSDGSIVFPTTEGTTWSYHNLIEMNLDFNYKSKNVVPTIELQQLHILEKIHARDCWNLEEVFEVTNTESPTVVIFQKLREMKLDGLARLKYIWKSNEWSILKFPNLTRIYIDDCISLEHVFTASMVGSLVKLQELHITWCEKLEVIVKKEEEKCDDKVGEILFPCLKSLKLEYLASLEGFCLGKVDLLFPSMNTLVMNGSPKLKIFNEGLAISPELKLVETSFGGFKGVEDINIFVRNKIQEARVDILRIRVPLLY